MSGRLTDIKIELCEKLKANIPEFQCSPYMLSDPTPPAAHIFLAPTDYDETFGTFQGRGSDEYLITLQVFVATAGGDEGAQIRLDEYMEPYGPRSIKQALETLDEDEEEGGQVTLGGACDDLHVMRCEGERLYLREGKAPVLGSEWAIKVTAPGHEEA